MSDRTLAIEILTKARTTLAERLTEKIVEQGEDILADASGDSYMNEIESLYEQVGLKLSHISQMLSSLPIESPPAHTETACAQHTAEDTFTVATEAAFTAQACAAARGVSPLRARKSPFPEARFAL